MSEEKKRTPAGLSTAGRRLYRDVIGSYDLEVHEELLLIEACRVADRLDRLHVEAGANPAVTVNAKGDLVAHPALVEARQQALVLSRLLASLRLPAGDDGGLVRPQRRGASRGAYGVRGVA